VGAAGCVERLGAEAVAGDLGRYDSLVEGAEGCDTVFHLAAKVDDWGRYDEFYRTNVEGTENVLAAARAAGATKFMHASTEAVLVGGRPIVGATEAWPRPARPLGHYPLTKGMAEDRVIAANSAAMQTVIVRPRLVWGRGDTSVLPKMVRSVRNGTWRWISGGRYLTSTCHVANACAALLLAAERGGGGEIYFVTDGEPVEFRWFATELLRSRGLDPGTGSVPRPLVRVGAWLVDRVWRMLGLSGRPPVTPCGLRLIGVETTMDDSKIRRELGYRPVMTLGDGMSQLAGGGGMRIRFVAEPVRPLRGCGARRPSHRSRLVRGWNVAARRLGLSPLSPDLSVAGLIEGARRRTHLDDFGGDEFREPLEVLLESLEETGRLHPFGRFYVRQMVSGLLANRLRLAGLWKRKPEMLEQSVTQPIVIMGLPRTGTSLLFSLLAQDPGHRFLSNWEATVSQVPPERDGGRSRDPRRRTGRILLALQNYLAPDLRHLHEFRLDGPEECTPLLMQSFATQALAGVFDVPAYSRWLDGASHLAGYRHHKRILQTLQWRHPGGRWVLKSPDHTAAVEAVLTTCPDACVVHLHRDPVKSVASWASLMAVFRGICSDSVDCARLGRQVLDRLSCDLEAGLRQRRAFDRLRFFDLHYDDLLRDPLSAVHRLYGHFRLHLSVQAEGAMASFLAIEGERSRRVHRYDPGEFGLTREEIRGRFGDYMRAFGIRPEGRAAARPRRVDDGYTGDPGRAVRSPEEASVQS
jgi:nucleoside-diphosphate-sugar epimerase